MRAPAGLLAAVVIGAAIATAPAPEAQEAPLLAAMADELARSMAQLRLKDQPAPYFIEYEVEDRASTRVTARLGALVEDLSGRGRTLRVGVRVGDYAFDNSLFNAPATGGVIPLQADGSTSAPLDDDYDAMRRQIWLATDAAYKRAVSVFARKRAAFQNRTGTAEALPDFSREEPVETRLAGLPATIVNRDWPARAREISAVFLALPAVEGSEVSVADTRGTRFYVNSEGFKTVAPIAIASLRVSADTQAADGMTVRDLFMLVEKQLQDLPPVAAIAARARAMGERLAARRVAPVGEEYAGPILVEGDASAELLAQSFLPSTLARRPAESAGRGGRGGPPPVTPFLRRIGLRVITDSFTVRDTPSMTSFDGRPVPGAYVVDDHGIRAKDITLVEKGRLMTLVAGRAPLRGLLQSSGHTRGGDVQTGVVVVESDEAVPASELRARYLKLLETQDKPFGYIVRGLAIPADLPGAGPGGPMILEAVKVTRDGREEPVRGVRLGPVPAAAFRDVLDASRERTLYSFRGTNTDAISIIAPNLILEELEVVQALEISQKPPLVPSPLSD